jgi:hypothetical protein
VSCSHVAAQPPSEKGFYRQGDDRTVFYVQPAAKTTCVVANPSMMEAFGGFGQVKVVGQEVDLRGSKPLASCAWPTGRYRKVNSDVVFDVRGDAACREPRGAKAPARDPVLVISSDSDVTANKRFSGDCAPADQRR